MIVLMNVGKLKQGFTIVELLIVVVVIAILAAITIVSYNGITQRAKASALQSGVSQLTKKLEADKIATQTDTYPASITTPTNITYSASPSGKAFCVAGKDGSILYYATNTQLQPSQGSCVTADGLVGWWQFNGDTNDVSGSGTNAVLSGQTLVPGQNGKDNGAYSFSGTTNMTASAAQLPTGSSARTVLAWVYPTQYPGSGWSMVHSYGSTAARGASSLSISTAGKATFNGQSNDFISDITVGLNGWHLMGYTLNDTQINIIYDDTSQASTLGNSPVTAVSANAFIGSYVGATNKFKGNIDDLRVYNRVLSNSEIQAIYAAGAV